jgi:ketohexokinase
MARVLLVGTATLDLVFELDHHPGADEEMRARTLRTCRGGNAANSAVVLSRMGHQAEFFGTLAQAAETAVIENDFRVQGVTFEHCPKLPGLPPTSSIYLSGASRSIVHYRDLPELSLDHFEALDPSCYDLIHFECRNVPVLEQAMRAFRARAPEVRLTLELEKPRAGMESLYTLADAVICSRGFAMHQGHAEPEGFLHWMGGQMPQAVVALGWGEEGAYCRSQDGTISHAPAIHHGQAVDTLGAGDTFNAGFLGALADHASLSEALARACDLAGRKCAIRGFNI